jgi:hypothetical protein
MIYLIIYYKIIPNISKKSLYWIFFGVLLGIVASLFLGFCMSYNVKNIKYINEHEISLLVKGIPQTYIYQLGYAAVSEEPLFKGFLWGYLEKKGINNYKILLFQTILFTVAHIYYFPDSLLALFIIVPVSTLIFG